MGKDLIKKEIWLLILSTVFILFFSLSTSPLYDYVGYDSMVFRVVAKGWADGKMLYSDMFDNKGPYLYVIQRIGLMISWDYGILLLEILNLFVALNLLCLIGNIILDNYFPKARKGVVTGIGLFAFLLMTLVYHDGGNLTEEWSLNFILLPLWLFLKSISTGVTNTNTKASLVYGMCFGVLFFIRINNAGAIVAIMLTIAALSVINGHWTSLFKNIAWFILGFCATTAPIIIYFAMHGALYDLFFCTYIFNWEYMANWKPLDNTKQVLYRMMINLVFMSYVVWLMIVVLSKIRHFDKAFSIMLLSLCVIDIASFITTVGYPHYFLIMTPMFFILTVLVCSAEKKYLVFLVLSLMALPYPINVNCRPIMQFCIDRYQTTRVGPISDMVKKHVSAGDYDKIYPYDIDEIAIFHDLAVYPAPKYMALQKQYSRLIPEVKEEIDAYNKNTDAQYILTNSDINDEILEKTIAEKYQFIDSVNGIVLYGRKHGDM